MIQICADGRLVYDSRLPEYELAGLRTTRGLNKGGTAEIVMPPGHPAYYAFTGYKTIVEIYRDGALKFRGRALYPVDDFSKLRTVVCEGELCFFQDAVSRPYLYQDSPSAVFRAVIAAYNSQVEAFKQFVVGAVTVTDPNDYIRLESQTAEAVKDTLDKLVERCGGYITFTTNASGQRVVNWESELASWLVRQTIEAGENLFDLQRSGANTNLVTAVVPYGAQNEETGERVTIASVNGGKDYIKDENAAALYGTILATVTWDDVTKPENLLRKAQEYLDAHKVLVTSLKISALDRSIVDKSFDSFDPGNDIRVNARAHGLVDESFRLTDISEDWLNPADSTIELSKETTSSFGDVIGADQSLSALDKVIANVKKDYQTNTEKAVTSSERRLTSLIEQTAQTIRLEVSESYVTSDKLSSYALRSELEMLAGSISLSVSGSLGGKASISLSANGQTDTQELDLSGVRSAFANDKSTVTISGGKITFNSGTLVINATNLKVSANGTLTATNAELSGKLTAENGDYKSELNNGALIFYYAGTELGRFTSGYWVEDENQRGIVMHAEPGASYIAFAKDIDTDDRYDWSYVINYGMDPYGYTERHLYWESLRIIDGNLVLGETSGVAVQGEDEVLRVLYGSTSGFFLGNVDLETNITGSLINVYARTYHEHNVHFTEVAYFEKTPEFDKNASFANGYGVVVRDSADSATKILYMTTGDELRLGSSNYATKIYGESITCSTSVVISTGSLSIANGYGVRIKDKAGSYQYVIVLNTGDQIVVGSSSCQLRLAGSSVVLASSGATVTSDRRKKNSIEEIPEAYEAFLDALTPARFKFNDGTSGRYHVGFIAQEVEEALEAAGLTTQDFGGFVDLQGDGEELGLIYTEFVGLLLMKIKRLEQRIAALTE